MSVDLLAKKFDRLIAAPFRPLAGEAEAESTYRGMDVNAQYAHLRVACRPARGFGVDWDLRFGEQPDDEKESFFLIAFAAMLDVLAAPEIAPVLGMTMVVKQLETHPLRSTELAFRNAGRDIARQILRQTGQLDSSTDVAAAVPVSLGAAGLIIQ